MTGVLGRLERGGWIERRPDAADRRSVRIRAAGAGGFKARPGDTVKSWQDGYDYGGTGARPGDTVKSLGVVFFRSGGDGRQGGAAAAGKKADPHPGCPPAPGGRNGGGGALRGSGSGEFPMRTPSNGPDLPQTGCGDYCTWEREDYTIRFRVFRAIPRFPQIVIFLLTLSHVQRGPLCTWEDFTGVDRQGVPA